MIGFMNRLLTRSAPVVAEARQSDAAAFAAVHADSFRRGWSEQEFHRPTADAAMRGICWIRISGGWPAWAPAPCFSKWVKQMPPLAVFIAARDSARSAAVKAIMTAA